MTSKIITRVKETIAQPPLIGLFFISGLSGLIYEVVWMRMLIRVFGITLYATSTIISVYMGGLAIGSWAAGRLSAKKPLSLRLYGGIELAVAATALLSTRLIQMLPGLNALFFAGGNGVGSPMLYRLVLSALVLLPPTFLMGSTLPLLSQWINRRNPSNKRGVALLYGFNTLGAVCGVLLTGFYSIGVWGEMSSIELAVALNILVGVVALWLSTLDSARIPFAATKQRKPRRWYLLLCLAAASGSCALAYEVLWTRLLILILGTSIYAFSAILVAYLAGLALGSLAVVRWIDKMQSSCRIFGCLEIALALLGGASLWIFRYLGLAASDIAYLYSPLRDASSFVAIFYTVGLVVFPLTLLMGAAFPILERAMSQTSFNSGESVGDLYAWNTAGGVLGSLAVGFWLIPALGTQATFYLVSLLNLAIGLAALAMDKTFSQKRNIALVLVATISTLLIFPSQSNIFLDILSRRLRDTNGAILFHREDPEATVTVFGNKDWEMLFINGIMISGKGGIGEFMAHLPILLHPHPSSALVICFGAGNTFRAATYDLGHVDAVELLPSVIESFKIFYSDAKQYLSHPGTRVIINDGRNYILSSKELYDVIVVDASPPLFSAGTVNLYSLDFLELSKRRLTDSGIFTLWVPFPCFESDFWMIAKNFTTAFKHVAVWAKPETGGILLMGSSSPFESSPRVIDQRLIKLKIKKIIPWPDASTLLSGFVLSENELRAFAQGFPNVTDNNPYTEFPMGHFLRRESLQGSPDFLLKARHAHNTTSH